MWGSKIYVNEQTKSILTTNIPQNIVYNNTYSMFLLSCPWAQQECFLYAMLASTWPPCNSSYTRGHDKRNTIQIEPTVALDEQSVVECCFIWNRNSILCYHKNVWQIGRQTDGHTFICIKHIKIVVQK